MVQGRHIYYILFTICILFQVVLLDYGSDGKVIAAFVMPHGGIALDPSHFNTTNATAKKEAWEIHDSCLDVGCTIRSLRPDTILLSSPHGVADLNNFLFYMNPKAAGFADTDNCVCPPCCYNVSVQIDVSTSKDLVQHLGLKRNVSGLSAFGPPGQSDEPFPLRWGEVIPLHFVPGIKDTKVIVLSEPSRRYTESVAMIPELLRFGASLFHPLEASSQRIVYIVSGDLAHTHSASGPYGYSNASEPFDQAVGLWAANMDANSLLEDAASLTDKALSCGFTGFVRLQGLFQESGMHRWSSKVLINHHPSYYGMMVAEFLRKDLKN